MKLLILSLLLVAASASPLLDIGKKVNELILVGILQILTSRVKCPNEFAHFFTF